MYGVIYQVMFIQSYFKQVQRGGWGIALTICDAGARGWVNGEWAALRPRPLYPRIYIYIYIQGYSKWFSGYSSTEAIPHQIRETITTWQFHSKVVCTVSRDRVCFLSRNWRYESEQPLKPSPLTCYKQFGTNSIIGLMFVESQRVHI